MEDVIGEDSVNLADLGNVIKNMDVMALLKKMIDRVPENEQSDEFRQKFQETLTRYEAMTEDEKLQFTSQIKKQLADKLSFKLDGSSLDLSGLQEAINDAVMYKIYMAVGVAIVVLFLLVFFGYKLYKSIKDKELKREEKKKAKQMKKKK